MQMFHPRMPSSTEILRLPAAILVAACLFVPAANAQAQSPPSPSPERPDAPASIPDQKLDAVATALQQVAGLKRDYQQRVDVASQADKQRIIDEANGAITKAVTDQGLSVEEYTAIMVIAQNDPQVREKILQRLPPSDNPSGK
jgi:hypothetical protein